MLLKVFLNKKLVCKLKNIAVLSLVLVLLFLSNSFAHQGFYQLSKEEVVGNYELSVLQDFDIDKEGNSQGQLLLQLSHNDDVVSKETEVIAIIKFEGEEIATGAMDNVGGSSQDGKSFYSNYLFTLPITDLGTYSVKLAIDGEHGQAERQYFFKSKRINSWRSQLIEVIPSALILIICLVGGAILFLPVNQKVAGKKKGEQHV